MNPQPPEHHDDGFDQAIAGWNTTGPYQQQAYVDPTPYGNTTGIPADSIPVKPGITKRGKVVLALGTAVLASGGLLTWQHYETQAKASQLQAEELQYKRDLLALEMQKEMNKASQQNQKNQSTQDASRQKQVDACVTENKGLVGKQLGATYRSVLEDCQAQYPTTTSPGMQEAASSTDTTAGSAGVNTGLLVGGGVLVLGLVVAAKKATRSNPA